MITDDGLRALTGSEVYDHSGTRIGTVGEVWAAPAGQPSWISVRTGRPEPGESLMPLLGASLVDGRLHTPYAEALVTNAPRAAVDAERPLDSTALGDIHRHYSLAHGTASST